VTLLRKCEYSHIFAFFGSISSHNDNRKCNEPLNYNTMIQGQLNCHPNSSPYIGRPTAQLVAQQWDFTEVPITESMQYLDSRQYSLCSVRQYCLSLALYVFLLLAIYRFFVCISRIYMANRITNRTDTSCSFWRKFNFMWINIECLCVCVCVCVCARALAIWI
jgi:hypothetical protein